MRKRDTTGRLLATVAILFVAAACSRAAEEGSRTPSSAPTPSNSVVAGAITARVLGGGSYPGYSVVVPDLWSVINGHFVVKATNDPGFVLGLSVWDVDRVPTDPCHWKGHLVDPGPTVDDLVGALLAQQMRHPTEPTAVTLAGHAGTYLEWSVPADMVVTGDADFAGCDMWPDNSHRDFVSWLSTGDAERYEQVAGQVDRLWVLDVDGQRLVVDATYSPDTTQAERDELDQVANSLQFAAP